MLAIFTITQSYWRGEYGGDGEIMTEYYSLAFLFAFGKA